MASINTAPMGGFRYLISGQLSDLPDLFFKSTVTEISTAVNALGDAIEIRLPQSNMTDKAMETEVANQVFAAYDKLKENPELGQYFSPLSKLANDLGVTIVNVFGILRTGVKPEVDALRESVLGRTTEILEQENYDVLVSPNATLSTDFFIVNWDELVNKQGGISVVTDAMREYLKGYSTMASINDLRILISSQILTIRPFSINTDTAGDILDRVKNRLNDDVQKASVDTIFDLITDKYSFDKLVTNILGRAVASNEYGQILNSAIALLSDLYPVYEVFRTTPLDVTDEVLCDIQDNLTVLGKFFMSVAYLLLVMRQHFSTALVVSDRMLNNDNLQTFGTDGGTMEDVAKYMRVFYETKNIPVPFNGIPGSEIIEMRERATEAYNQLTQTHLMQASTIRHSIMTRAIRDILSDYIRSADVSRLPAQMSIEDFYRVKQHLVQDASNRLDISEDHHLDNILYDFVLSLWYEGTMVKTAHSLFGTEIVRQMEATTELDNETLALVDARVAAAICANFIMTEICTVR